MQELTRERVPLQWATTQTNLGIALQTLGERESDPVRLEAARPVATSRRPGGCTGTPEWNSTTKVSGGF